MAITVVIAMMATAPCRGRSKTQMMLLLSPDQAAAMSAALLRVVTGNRAPVARSGPIAAYVAQAPEGAEGRFDDLSAPGTALILTDRAGAYWPQALPGSAPAWHTP